MRAFFFAVFSLLFSYGAQAAQENAVFHTRDECAEVVRNTANPPVYEPVDKSHAGDHAVNNTSIVLWELPKPGCGKMNVAKSLATLANGQAWVYLPQGSKIRKENNSRMYDDRCGNFIEEISSVEMAQVAAPRNERQAEERLEIIPAYGSNQASRNVGTIPVNTEERSIAQNTQNVIIQESQPQLLVLDWSGGWQRQERHEHRSHDRGYGNWPVASGPTINGNCNYSVNSCNNTVNTPPPPSNPPPVYNPPPPPVYNPPPSTGPIYNPPPPPTYNQPGGPTYTGPGNPVGGNNPIYTPPGSGTVYTPPGTGTGYTQPGTGTGYTGPGEPIRNCCNMTIDRSNRGAGGNRPRDPVGGGNSFASSKQMRAQAAPQGAQQVRGNHQGRQGGGRDRQ